MVAAPFDEPIFQGELREEAKLVVVPLLWVATDYVVRLLLSLVDPKTLKSTPIFYGQRISALSGSIALKAGKDSILLCLGAY